MAPTIPNRWWESSSQSSQPPPSDAKSAPSIFANLGNSQAQQPSTTSSLFGNTSQTQPSGGLFGSSTAAAGNQQQTQGSSLFGGTQPTQATGGSLFGTQSTQQSAGGLFGSTNSKPAQTQQSGGLFASLQPKQDQTSQAQSNLFSGLSNQNKAPSLLYVNCTVNARALNGSPSY